VPDVPQCPSNFLGHRVEIERDFMGKTKRFGDVSVTRDRCYTMLLRQGRARPVSNPSGAKDRFAQSFPADDLGAPKEGTSI